MAGAGFAGGRERALQAGAGFANAGAGFAGGSGLCKCGSGLSWAGFMERALWRERALHAIDKHVIELV